MKQTIESIMRYFQNSGKRHLLLTGTKGSGKTTRFLGIAKRLCKDGAVMPGITTYAIPKVCVMLQENGTSKECEIGRYTDQMRPVEDGFLKLGIPTLERAMQSDSEWIFMDELGFLENECILFQEAVLHAFDTKRVLAVIRKQELPFLSQLKTRNDVCLVDLDETKAKVGCVIMASGKSIRFGKNKLLQEFQGKTLLQRVLDTTSGELFDKRIVITRSPEVELLCKTQKIDVIFHDFPHRNDVVRLGTERLREMDAIVFCPCDQPLLKRESLEKMLSVSYVHEDGIVRMAFEERRGAPILFGKKYFPELCELPEKVGGSYLVKKYPDKVSLVETAGTWELEDIDTQEDFEWLTQLAKMLGETV